MKKTAPVLLLFMALILGSCTTEQTQLSNKVYNQGINITPKPQQISIEKGEFTLTPKTVITANGEDVQKVGNFFSTKFKQSTGYDVKVVAGEAQNNAINLILDPNVDFSKEGYLLTVNNNGVTVTANNVHGLFYGMQSLLQLFPAEIESPNVVNAAIWTAPAVTIQDDPKLGYRGQMLDVCRHFSSIDYIKKQLDVLAMLKINKFHWHLTEDQGWRIEIKKYPELTKISSMRTEGEGDTYGPYFFTQDEVKEVVAYAKERFIEVIPEIELPGHGVAALAAYPEFSCTGGPFDVRNIWGVSNDIYCAGNEETFKFLEDVISEVVPLFESEYFHIGGDEAPKTRWKECPKCQARIKAEGIKGDKNHTAEEKLQSYFIRRIQKVLDKHNKKLIGWDEILEGGLAPSATVMSWRGEEGGITAGNMGHDVIMTPSPWFYLDAFQGDPNLSPTGIGSYTKIKKTYSYNPIPEKLAEDKRHHILGVQANVWTEYMYSPDLIEYYTYPRIAALAEVGWTNEDQKDYADFERRLDNLRARLDMHDINYYIPLPEDKGENSCNDVVFIDNVTLEFDSSEPVQIVYTTDSSEPNLKSEVYSTALTFDKPTTLKLRSVLPTGKMSEIRVINITKGEYQKATSLPQDYTGITADHYKGITHKVSDLEERTPDETEIIRQPKDSKHIVKNYRELLPEDYYSTIMTGYFYVNDNDVYYFKSTADQLWIDDVLLLDNEGIVKKQAPIGKSIALEGGIHKFKMIRTSGIVGGWPPLWEPLYIMMKTKNDSKYNYASESFYIQK